MSNCAAELYLGLMGDDREARLALLACAASLRLDDETALEAIHLVAGSNGHSEHLLHRIKRLGCVWTDWNGAWYLAEEVRAALEIRLDLEVEPDTVSNLRARLAERACRKAEALAPDGQITAYETRLLKLEAGFQRTLLPRETAGGAADLADLWTSENSSGQRAVADAVDSLASAIERHQSLPPEVLFLQGMAARHRGDRARATDYFRRVWEQGRAGEIFAIAAHLFGNAMAARRKTDLAEQALRDSIAWNRLPHHQGQVWHSLGNLLAKDRRRWTEAEAAYQQSLDLLTDPQDLGKVWHSLGNLLAKDRRRRTEAEAAYQQSLDLRTDPQDLAQVWHSLGNLLAKDRRRWTEAEAAYQRSLDLDPDPHHQGQVYASWADALAKNPGRHDPGAIIDLARRALDLDGRNPRTAGVAYRVLADAYEQAGRLREAVDALENLVENDRRLGHHQFNLTLVERIADLKARIDQGG